MPTKKPTTKKQGATPTPPPTPDYIIGSNLGHAQREAAARGLPRALAITITDATPSRIDGKTVILARAPGDLAVNWDHLKNYGATIID